METYSASLDVTAKILTGFVFLLLIFGFVLLLTQTPWFSGLVVMVISLIILIPTYIYSVQCYQITDEAMIIKRPFSIVDKKIPFSEIVSVKLLTKEDMKGTWRTGGNGGLFGYTGYYANNNLGTFLMYCTNGKNRILITLKDKDKRIVISPDDARMVDALQKRILHPLPL